MLASPMSFALIPCQISSRFLSVSFLYWYNSCCFGDLLVFESRYEIILDSNLDVSVC